MIALSFMNYQRKNFAQIREIGLLHVMWCIYTYIYYIYDINQHITLFLQSQQSCLHTSQNNAFNRLNDIFQLGKNRFIRISPIM